MSVVCLFVCLSAHITYLKNHVSKFHQIFCTYYLWMWLDLPLMSDYSAISYVISLSYMT